MFITSEREDKISSPSSLIILIDSSLSSDDEEYARDQPNPYEKKNERRRDEESY